MIDTPLSKTAQSIARPSLHLTSARRNEFVAVVVRQMIATGFVWAVLLLMSSVAIAQPMAPRYDECRFDSIFPSSAQRGTSVKVELKGHESGFVGMKEILIDGPPGVTAKDFKVINGYTAEATLEIAADAPLGRRWLRIVSERCGLTNFAYFIVGGMPERLELEPNNEADKAERVQIPLVLNGRINPAADLDVFRFAGKKGQHIVAAIAAHGIDIHGQNRDYGIADFSLELLDLQGRTLATAEDTLGFDPLIELTLPQDGDYLVRVQLLNYQGFPEAVYRLTLGDVPYVTAVFPPGFRRGTATEIELTGPNVAPGTKQILGKASLTGAVTEIGTLVAEKRLSTWMGEEGALWDPVYPLRHLVLDQPGYSGFDVPVVVGDLPEAVESEPNDDRGHAGVLTLPGTMNGRFQRSDDADWYRVRLNAQQKIQLEIVAQRFIRSPVDTLLQIYNEQGQLLVENDDEVFEPGYEQYHDFKTTDSKLVFTAPAAAEYFIKVTEQSGVNGPRAMYRLTAQLDQPDFRLSHFPDGVPIWGPGSTACVLVRVDRFSGCNDDIEVSMEGLPAGWTTRSATSLATTPERPLITYQAKVFLTVTAPPDAVVGSHFPFRIVGRAKRADGTILQRRSMPLTLYYSSDTGFFRASPVSRVVVAKSQGPWLEAIAPEISIAQGGNASIAVKVHGAADHKQMPIVVNIATFGVACVLNTPQNLPIINGQVEVPIKLPPEVYPGTYGITIAQSWRSDIRIGMPGPCTGLIRLTVLPAK